jgi:hypothetical protein
MCRWQATAWSGATPKQRQPRRAAYRHRQGAAADEAAAGRCRRVVVRTSFFGLIGRNRTGRQKPRRFEERQCVGMQGRAEHRLHRRAVAAKPGGILGATAPPEPQAAYRWILGQRTIRAVVVLPQPDSPTGASVRLLGMVKETSSTARRERPFAAKKLVGAGKSLIGPRASMIGRASLMLRSSPSNGRRGPAPGRFAAAPPRGRRSGLPRSAGRKGSPAGRRRPRAAGRGWGRGAPAGALSRAVPQSRVSGWSPTSSRRSSDPTQFFFHDHH